MSHVQRVVEGNDSQHCHLNVLHSCVICEKVEIAVVAKGT